MTDPSGGPHVYPCQKCEDPKRCSTDEVCAYLKPKWSIERLEELRIQAMDKHSRAAQQAYINGLEYELRLRLGSVQEPVCWRREWDGDDNLGQWVYAESRDELDEHGPWQPLYDRQ